MIEPGDRVIHGFDGWSIRRGRPAQHNDVDTKRARRGDLAVGRGAAAVLGDHASMRCAVISARSSASLNGPRPVT